MDTINGITAPLLVIEAPPRHGKSMLISRFLPAWYLGRYPDRFVLLASASDRLAEKWGREARSVFSRFGKEYFGVTVSEVRKSASDWNTEMGGGMVTAGVGGDIMGRDGHLLIIDDYLKSSEAAVSETIRQKQWDWWQSTFSTRMEPGAVVIVMATRWHEDDLIGKLLHSAEEGDGLPVRRVSLPAIAGENDLMGREPGEALWPERWPLGEKGSRVENAWGQKTVGLNMRKAAMEVYWWNAEYQQRPGRHGRTEWPDEYFDNIWTEDFPDAFEACVIAVDPSKGADMKRGDYSAIVFVGLSGGKLWIDASVSRRPPSQIVADGIKVSLHYKPDAFGIESNAFQDLFAPIFHTECEKRSVPPLPIVSILNTVKKELRIGRIGPWLANDKLRFLRSSGNRILVKQLQEFPLADHDDGPDALEMAIRLLREVSSRDYEEDETHYEVVG